MLIEKFICSKDEKLSNNRKKTKFLIVKKIENYALLKFIEQLQDHNT